MRRCGTRNGCALRSRRHGNRLLEATHYFKAACATYANGVHLVAVDVNVNTSQVQVVRYVIVDDCGPVLNPLLMRGQILGACRARQTRARSAPG